MQLTKTERKFDSRRIEQILINENKFITDLFSNISFPTRLDEGDSIDEEQQNESIEEKPQKHKETTRAKSLSELQERLVAITSKKKLTYKEKLTKKNIKNRMKKKTKADQRNSQAKLTRAQKLIKPDPDTELLNGSTTSNVINPKPAKPVFNSEGKMVFSKFDFSNIGTNKSKKHEKDPRKLLDHLEKQKEKFNELVEHGEISKAVEINEKAAWKNAMAKAEGEKIRDDPTLLKRSVKVQENKKNSSKKKWEARKQGVEKAKQDKQAKRTENIDKRKKDKKMNKLKKAVKRGKVIPGF